MPFPSSVRVRVSVPSVEASAVMFRVRNASPAASTVKLPVSDAPPMSSVVIPVPLIVYGTVVPVATLSVSKVIVTDLPSFTEVFDLTSAYAG